MKRLLALLAILAVLPTSAQAWWNADWQFRKKITLNTADLGSTPGETVSNVPVAVRLHTGNFLFTDAKPDGSDIRFVAADDKTPLKHHVEVFDAANQLAILWVQVPRVASKTPTEAIWMYTGNAKVPSADDAKGVYGQGQRLRLNFSEPDGAFKDASAYANTVTGNGVKSVATGIAGGAAAFSGNAMKVSMAEGARVAPGSGAGLSLGLWIKPANAHQSKLVRWGGLLITLEGDRAVASLGGVAIEASGLKAGEWHHLGVSVSDQLSVYLDGRPLASQPVTMPEFAGEMSLGEGFNGEIDALEVSGAVRPALWFQTEAAQTGEAFVTYGEPEDSGAEGDSHGGYIGVLMNSLTVDAKIVIAILAVMFAVAVYVMVTKALLVARTDKHNTHFLDVFERSPQVFLDPRTQEAKHMQNGGAPAHSTLARLYATGMRELSHRVKGDRLTGISAEGLASIRAAIDSTLIRENQKLNRLMVLLTIAISGGPFLGLLGTVVGVMITFAAIAAAGDVNINAIAPGIAAALLATVAGLGVAIPSLFGYNYLLTRIKNITADMQAFADEFITRMAEAHTP